ncbi:GSCOCG00006102001-RA-CDS, partial [Cotesia congregata]
FKFLRHLFFNPTFIMDVQLILSDLSSNVPGLQYLLRPEYAPYLNTAGTVLLGWMVVCWLLNLLWTFLAPLAISVLGIIIICPETARWVLGQLGPSAELFIENIISKFQSFVP